MTKINQGIKQIHEGPFHHHSLGDPRPIRIVNEDITRYGRWRGADERFRWSAIPVRLMVAGLEGPRFTLSELSEMREAAGKVSVKDARSGAAVVMVTRGGLEAVLVRREAAGDNEGLVNVRGANDLCQGD
ncbi:unnamed protein product [Sphenostylis stenocarpa]|uniref:Uncharacterized protein n=1 Tax=Sphenostylis stenocarpa TaxID=92480 RepID=A0AA86SLN5_9FABA|nr:unnamed protein product [Sphenostylis stenocarpa]